MAGPVGVEELTARLINALVGVRAKVVPLGLEQVRREALAAEAVKVCQRACKGRNRNSALYSRGDNSAPWSLSVLNNAGEKGIKQQVFQVRVFVKSFLDFTQKDRADNTAAAPHQGDTAVVEVPLVLFCRFSH